MAGVPGQSPDQKLAALRATMQPGDYLMQDGSGSWTVVRRAQRDPDQSVLGTLGELADKYLGFGSDRRRSRVLAGVASQWYGLDEAGNPTFGKTPGIVYETKALAALPTMLGRAGMDLYMEKILGPVIGTKPGQITSDPIYQMVQKELLSDPEFATNAAAKADRIHQAVREDMHLKAPRGFAQNAQESLGVMLGQLPVPGRAATEAAEGAPGALKRLGQGAEWFTPTVEAKPVNYGIGAVTGGALGALGDEADTPTVVPGDQPGLYDVRPAYPDGSVGYSGNAADQGAAAQAQEENAQHSDGGSVNKIDKCDGGMSTVSSMRARYAEGGKVNSALRAIKEAIAHLDNGDTGSALRTLQSSPEALRDPGIAQAMQRLKNPATAKVARKALDTAVTADTNVNKVSTFKKGGLTTRARNALPDSTFAGPDRSYPISDASHAANAKGRAKQQLNKGNLSSSQYSSIVARANKLLKD